MKSKQLPTSMLKNALSWLDEHTLILLVGFLLAFIPLYPKLPLADLLTGYIVRLRLDDLLIAFTFVVWGIQVLRKKATLNTPLSIMIGLYLVVGLASSISAIYWTHTVPMSMIHIAKLFLHYFRRIEYFSLFFIAYSALQRKDQVKKLLIVFCVTAALVSIYGIGQKYLYWPVYSTMNREFSKGIRLYLTEHARVQSTFGGHYDYAAYLTIALPVIIALSTVVRRKKIFFALCGTFLASLWGLMMTSSRSSFLAYITGLTIVLVLLGIKKGWFWWISRSFVLYSVTAVFLLLFGDLLLRFSQIFQGNEAFTAFQESVEQAKEKVQTPIIEKPKDGVSVDDLAKAAAIAAAQEEKKPVINQSDTLPTPIIPEEQDLPADVYENIPAQVVATKSAEGKEIVVVIPRVFSENAHRLGLSAAIRLDTLWPFAIRGFLRNPLLGSGYSTLTKYTNDEFTQAESTDNDFLRTLGETGLLGFLTFYGTMVAGMIYLWKKYKKTRDGLLYIFASVLTAVTLGLMVNAVYIDIFVSSKVIQTYWLLTGVLLAYAGMVPDKKLESSAKRKI